MLKRLELPNDLHHELIDECKGMILDFLTPFDVDSLHFLTKELDWDRRYPESWTTHHFFTKRQSPTPKLYYLPAWEPLGDRNSTWNSGTRDD